MSDKLKMSALLRLGARQVKAKRGAFLGPSKDGKVVCYGCAVGMIAVAKAGTLDWRECRMALEDMYETWDSSGPMAEVLSEVNHRFELGRQSPKQIARWLESKGL